MVGSVVRTTVSRWLEEGALSGAFARTLARAHAPFASRGVARPLVVPATLRAITIGGATLGGSGKTRVALACVRELEALGASVVLIGHGYRARSKNVQIARIVSAADRIDDVGDEALACARALAGTSARVALGPTRQAAIDFVAQLSPRVDIVVIDGPLQLAPVRAALSILALDADAPWGAGSVAPAGDLRAPRASLLANADHVMSVDALPRGAMLGGARVALDALARTYSRIGLFTAIARPHRLVRALANAGLAPRVIVRAADHGPLTTALAREIACSDVDLWMATEKCALHLASGDFAKPLATLDGGVALSPTIMGALEAVRHGTTCVA